jgi:dipeptidase E
MYNVYMKLFLSSEGVPHPDLLRELLGIGNEAVRVALINNAQDPYPAERATERGVALADLFTTLGFEPVYVDLREYEGKTDDLDAKLRTCKLIWCSGGNSFWLRYVMKTSGFDQIIKQLLADGIVYGGWSAGVVLVGPSLHPIELMDEPNKAPEVIYEGLNLVDYFIWPHWNTEKYVHLQAEGSKRMSQLPYEALTLKDGEVITVENGERRLVS